MSVRVNISDLVGKTIKEIIKRDDRLTFVINDGSKYEMYHEQDCCEHVSIEDIIGDLEDLVGSPILTASEDTSDKDPNDKSKSSASADDWDYRDSFTWTFYNLSTFNGHVTIRWYGESNGYYSESVDVFYTEAVLEEHDVVVSLVDIGEVPMGSSGTIVHIYRDDFEVEFVSPDGSSIIETVNRKQIKKV